MFEDLLSRRSPGFISAGSVAGLETVGSGVWSCSADVAGQCPVHTRDSIIPGDQGTGGGGEQVSAVAAR